MKSSLLALLFLASSIGVYAQLTVADGVNMPGYWDAISKPNPPGTAVLRMANPPGTSQKSDAPTCSVAYGGGTIDLYNNLYSTQPLSSSVYRATLNNTLPTGYYDGGTGRGFMFTSGPCGNYDALKWGNVTVAMNSVQNYTRGSAVENSITLGIGKYYTVNFNNPSTVATAATNQAIFFETSSAPALISSVSHNYSSVCNGANGLIVTVNMNSNPAAEQKVFVRYSTTAFASSTYTPVVFADTANPSVGKAVIPFSSGSTVTYYAMTTTISQSTMQASYSAGSTVANIATLHADNNGSANYTYTFPLAAYSQALSGYYLIDNTATTVYPNSFYFNSLATAVSSLNTYGMCGHVVISLPAGYSENVASPGININMTALASSLQPAATQTLWIKKFNTAAGTPSLIAFSGSNRANNSSWDGIMSLQGTDFTTIDRIKFDDPASNANNQNGMEYGLAFFKSATDGCKNVVVSKCEFDLNIYNATHAFGAAGGAGQVNNAIMGCNSTRTSASTNIVVTTTGGRHENISISGCVIENCNNGIAWNGYEHGSLPYDLTDQRIIIGGNTAAEGNTIRKFSNNAYGTAGTAVYGIKTRHIQGLEIVNNSIDNAALGTAHNSGAIRGIWTGGTTSSTNASIRVCYNTVKLTVNFGSTTSGEIVCIRYEGNAGSSNADTFSYNTLSNCSQQSVTANWSGDFYGMYFVNDLPKSLYIVGNNISNNTNACTFTVPNSNRFYGIMISGAAVAVDGNYVIDDNILNNNSGNWRGMQFIVHNGTSPFYNMSFQNNIMGTSAEPNTMNVVGPSSASSVFGIANTLASVLNLTVKGNKFVNFKQSGSGITGNVYGFYLNGSPASGLDDVSNNVLRDWSLITDSEVNGIFSQTASGHSVLITNDSIINIYNNESSTLKGIICNSATNMYVLDNYMDSVFQTDGHSQDLIAIENSIAGDKIFCKRNFINNFGMASAGSSHSMEVYGISTQAASVNSIQSNIIKNLKVYGSNHPVVVGITKKGGAAATDTLANNRIEYLYQLDASPSGAAEISGIEYNNGTAPHICFNSIHALYNSGNSTSTKSYGLNVIAGNGPFNIYNNIIQDLTATAANNANAVAGIYMAVGAQLVQLYYNTVALGYGSTLSSSGANFGATAVQYAASGTGAYDFRNNIFYLNGTAAGNGFMSALRRSSGVASVVAPNFSSNSNNNLLYVPATGGNFLYAEGLNTGAYYNAFTTNPAFVDVPANNLLKDLNFNGACGLFKTFMTPREALSFTEDISLRFTGGSVYPDNLQLSSGVSFAEKGAQPISSPAIATDYFGNSRHATTPDMGAHEFNGSTQDVSGPSISYTNIPTQSCYTSGPTLSAVITDTNGVKVASGNRPRLWFKKSSELDVLPAANTSAFNGWKYVEASNSSSPFNFTINYSLLNSTISPSDVIQYFVVASDSSLSSNVSAQSAAFSGGCLQDVSLSTVVFPTLGSPVINSYANVWSYAGTLQMSDSADWIDGLPLTSFTNAGGLFDKINSASLAGHLIVEVDNNFTAETGAIALKEWTNGGCMAGSFSLTIQPKNNTVRTISGSPIHDSLALIRFDGADNVTINGAYTSNLWRLIFDNTSTTNTEGVFAIQSGVGGGVFSAGCLNVGIYNCEINGSGLVAGNSGIAVCGANSMSDGADNDDITINGNIIQSVDYGVQVRGTAPDFHGGCDGIIISGNEIGQALPGTDIIGTKGIYIHNVEGTVIADNIIRRVGSISSNGVKAAIHCDTSSNGRIEISGNRIERVASADASVYGILMEGDAMITGSDLKITANEISGLRTNAVAQNNYGILYNGYADASIVSRISDNSITNDTASNAQSIGILLSGRQPYNSIALDSNSISNLYGDEVKGLWMSSATDAASIRENDINNLYADNGEAYGIRTDVALSNAQYALNVISSVNATAANAYGLFIDDTADANIIDANTISEIRNSSNSGSKGGKGIFLRDLGSNSSLIVSNNMISGMDGDGSNLAIAANYDANVGLWFDGNTDDVSIYNNSINLYGSAHSGSVAAAKAACLVASGSMNDLRMQNNIFSNTYDNPAMTDDTAYNFLILGSSLPFSESDYNDYFKGVSIFGSNWYVAAHYNAGALVSRYQTLASWMADNASDSNSLQVNPKFVSNNDLHSQSCQLNMHGKAVAGVSYDMDGDLRNAGTPDIGADEYLLDFTALPTNLLSTAASGVQAQFECFTDDGWAHLYENGMDAVSETSDDILLISLKRNGNNIGYVSNGLNASVNTTANYGNDGHTIWGPGAPYVHTWWGEWEVAGRYWDVQPITQPTTNVDVRFYFDATDFQDINDKLLARGFSHLAAPDHCHLFKMLGTTSPDPSTNHLGVTDSQVVIYDHSVIGEAGPNWVYTSVGSIHQAEFSVSSFSGGGVGGAPYGTGPMPVDLLSLSATPINNEYIRVDWTTASELNNAGFEVLRSDNGMDFEKIGWVDGNGNSTDLHNYSFNDRTAVPNVMYYYKLNQIDFNGDEEESQAVTAMLNGLEIFEAGLYPNPANDNSWLEIQMSSESHIHVRIYNLIGEKVFDQNLEGSNGMNRVFLPTMNLANGTYRLDIECGINKIQKQLMVLH